MKILHSNDIYLWRYNYITLGSRYRYSTDIETPPCLIHYRYKIYPYIPRYQYTVPITRPRPGPLYRYKLGMGLFIGTNVLIKRPGPVRITRSRYAHKDLGSYRIRLFTTTKISLILAFQRMVWDFYSPISSLVKLNFLQNGSIFSSWTVIFFAAVDLVIQTQTTPYNKVDLVIWSLYNETPMYVNNLLKSGPGSDHFFILYW